MLLDDITEEEGYVIAVSEEPETAQEMYDIRAEYPIGTLFLLEVPMEIWQQSSYKIKLSNRVTWRVLFYRMRI